MCVRFVLFFSCLVLMFLAKSGQVLQLKITSSDPIFDTIPGTLPPDYESSARENLGALLQTKEKGRHRYDGSD